MRIMIVAALLLCGLMVGESLVAGGEAGERYEFVEEWKLWKKQHKKLYKSKHEDLERHIVWRANKQYIDMHNMNAEVFGYKVCMNHLADLTDGEFARKYLTYKMASHDKSKAGHKKATVTIYQPPQHVTWPESVDWRTRAAVTDIKDQMDCGASYAFAAAGSLEGAQALGYGELKVLSEQNIIDCSVPEGNNGCDGGNIYNSFMYIVYNDGLDTEKAYPYEGMQKPCIFTPENVGATMSGIVMIRSGYEYDLQAAVASVGPVATAVDATTTGFRFYSSGIYNTARCSSYMINHGMLVTGYGTRNDKDYWLVKNSWGKEWGMNGYILMTRNSYNQCGIATDASYPSL